MAGNAIPPPFVITDVDKRGLIVVTAAIVLAFVWLCSLIRIWMRFQSRDWKTDDSLLAAATLVHTAQTGVIFHLVQLGLGAPQDDLPLSQLTQLGKEGFATQILYVCTLFLSKCSVLFLYLRLSPEGSHRILSLICLAASAVWAITAIVLISIPCNPAQVYVVGPSRCTNRWPKWQAIGSIDIATEAFIFAIAMQLIWTLQMRLRSKIIVTIAFSTRLPVIAIAGVRLYFLHERFVENSETFEYLVATQWQMGYAIMSSTITGMGPLLRPFEKEYTTSYRKYGYGQSTGNSQNLSRSGEIETRTEADRNSWQSEGYLMQPVRSRPASRTTQPDSLEPSVISNQPSTTSIGAQGSSPPTAPNLLTADANFRPIDNVSRNDTEIWGGDRTYSLGNDQELLNAKNKNTLVINKRTQFKVEVDRASQLI